MELSQMIWLGLMVLFGIAEAATATLVSIWFCAGALAALLAALIAPDAVAVQVVVFLAVSALALLALRPLARRFTGGKNVPTNADANIGKLAQVVVDVLPERIGRVALEGLEWAAKSNAVLPAGSWCKVLAIEGAKLIVDPVPPGTVAGTQPATAKPKTTQAEVFEVDTPNEEEGK